MQCHAKQQMSRSNLTALLLFLVAVGPVRSTPSTIISPNINYYTTNATSHTAVADSVISKSVTSDVSASIDSISAVVECVLSTDFVTGEECLELILLEPTYTADLVGAQHDDTGEETKIRASTEADMVYERGLALVGHLSELVESSKDLTRSGFHDEKKKIKSLASLHAKWQSMHKKAEGSLQHALDLYHQAGKEEDAEVVSHIHELLGRLGDENDLATPASSSSSSSTHPTASQESAQDLVDLANTAMDRGMHFVHHMKEMLEAAGVYNNIDNNNDDKRRKHAMDTLSRKWSSVHERALDCLKEALQLFLRARKMSSSTTATEPFAEKLRVVRDVLEEVRNGDEVLPSSQLSKNHGKNENNKNSDKNSTPSLRGGRMASSTTAAGRVRGSSSSRVL